MSSLRWPTAALVSKELSTHEGLEDRQRPEHKQQRDTADTNCLRCNAVTNPLPHAGAKKRRKNPFGHHRRDGAEPRPRPATRIAPPWWPR